MGGDVYLMRTLVDALIAGIRTPALRVWSQHLQNGDDAVGTQGMYVFRNQSRCVPPIKVDGCANIKKRKAIPAEEAPDVEQEHSPRRSCC